MMEKDNTFRNSLLFVLFLSTALLIGCVSKVLSPQPTYLSPIDKHIMLIPKGTRIGDEVAPEDGIYIGKSKIIDMHIIEVPQDEQDVPKQEKKIRT